MEEIYLLKFCEQKIMIRPISNFSRLSKYLLYDLPQKFPTTRDISSTVNHIQKKIPDISQGFHHHLLTIRGT